MFKNRASEFLLSEMCQEKDVEFMRVPRDGLDPP